MFTRVKMEFMKVKTKFMGVISRFPSAKVKFTRLMQGLRCHLEQSFFQIFGMIVFGNQTSLRRANEGATGRD